MRTIEGRFTNISGIPVELKAQIVLNKAGDIKDITTFNTSEAFFVDFESCTLRGAQFTFIDSEGQMFYDNWSDSGDGTCKSLPLSLVSAPPEDYEEEQ